MSFHRLLAVATTSPAGRACASAAAVAGCGVAGWEATGGFGFSSLSSVDAEEQALALARTVQSLSVLPRVGCDGQMLLPIGATTKVLPDVFPIMS
jgi:hypothetical protein